ncbi:MAG: hypothetical protein COT24_04755 [Candidatus Kerfeldbacteria bacterium CG08_land_8_20_14_0_20_40_16]|uniref:DUF11 domain-containing protein n=1 Tax=Candidatus Kerfeldbacteria bacterium CG08_land_8_20_14_0_20_40_16 TaxID=2014244 RepID=A0A2H0YV63_9BACT|nr:MAG: hypothetical protein COT24_04755 [Candidatus Kerfeldbacteria bacterium CG08_land_8_20_14_0_20_40_16]
MTEKKVKKIPVAAGKKTSKDPDPGKSNSQEKTKSENEANTLVSIYRQDHRQEIDMTRMDRRKFSKKRLFFTLLVILLVMFAAASIAGFFIFNRGQGKKGESIELTITAPKTVDSGQEIELEITYLNKDNAAIKDADLTILYPDGFYFSHSEPQAQNEANTYWKIGRIDSGAGGRIKISGQIIGDLDSTRTFLTSLDYTPSNFNSVFETKASHSLEITSSIIDLSLVAPIRIVSGQETEINVKFKNNSKLPLSNLKIIATFPDGFSLKEADPAIQEDGQTWLVEELAANEENTIKLKGIFQGNPGDTKEILFQLGLMMDNGEFRLQTEKSAIVFLVKPELNLQLTINGNNQEVAVDLGDTLEYKINYKNASDLELRGVVLTAQFVSETDILNLSKVEDPQSGMIEEKSISWGAPQIQELSTVVPQAEGEFTFRIPTLSVISPLDETDRNFSIDNYIKVAAAESEDTTVDFEKLSESNHVAVKVNSKVNLEAEGHYYSEEFEKLGSGPLPPEVGETTSYRIFWSITNLYNDLENVEVTSVLPKDAFWTGHATSSTGEAVTFDAATRKVTWKVNRLSANTGQLFPTADANFEVSITPTFKQEGKLMVLVNESALSARDSFTNHDVEASSPLITTDLKNDPAAQGRGIVMPKSENQNLNQNSSGNFNNTSLNLNVN